MALATLIPSGAGARQAVPAGRGWLGSGWSGYLAQAGFAGGALLLLAAVLMTLPSSLGKTIGLKLTLIGGMLPLTAVWLVRSQPRSISLYAAAFLPGLPDGSDKLL